MPVCPAYLRTVSTSQASVVFDGALITRTPIIFLAIHLETAREMSDPPKPITAAKISSAVKFSPCPFSHGSTPSRRMLTESTSKMARLVARNRTMRFMLGSLASLP